MYKIKKFDALVDAELETLRKLDGGFEVLLARYRELREHHVDETKILCMTIRDLYGVVEWCSRRCAQNNVQMDFRGIARHLNTAYKLLEIVGELAHLERDGWISSFDLQT